jgi:hypothetical protein
MKSSGRPTAEKQAEIIDFVPKRDLDLARQENERLGKENDRLRPETERLKQETERLRRELEAALRAGERQAAPHSRRNPKTNPKRPGRKSGRNYGRQACRPTPSRVAEQIAPLRAPRAMILDIVPGEDCPQFLPIACPHP